MMIRTCIVCPKGCELKMTLMDEEELLIEGNQCPRGKTYGRQEFFAPVRGVQSTVESLVPSIDRVSVKTSRPVPKERILEVMAIIKTLKVTAPMAIGSAIATNILDLDVDVILTSDMFLQSDMSKETF